MSRELIISDIQTILVGTSWRNWCFVKVTTSDGLTGVGEAGLPGKEATVAACIQECKHRHALGRSAWDIEQIWLDWYRNEFFRGGAVVTAAISGVEIALWDILGKAVGQPVYRLMGGRVHDRLRAYANGWYVGEQSPQGYYEQAKKVAAMGYTALKFDPFGTSHHEIDRATRLEAIAIVEAVRDAVGPDVEIFIECHGRFNPETAIEIARDLEPFRPWWYEEPIPPENMDALARVAERSPLRLVTGERLYTRYGFADLLSRNIVGVIMPDICFCGGILETKKIAAMADARYISVSPHNPLGPVATAAALHLDTCTTNFIIQEAFDEFDVPWRYEVVRGAYRPKRGYFDIPDKPGLGVELDEAACAEHPYRPDAFFNMWGNGWHRKFF